MRGGEEKEKKRGIENSWGPKGKYWAKNDIEWGVYIWRVGRQERWRSEKAIYSTSESANDLEDYVCPDLLE